MTYHKPNVSISFEVWCEECDYTRTFQTLEDAESWKTEHELDITELDHYEENQ